MRRSPRAEELRAKIHALAASDDTDEKTRLLTESEDALDNVRLIGDLAIAAFFGAEKKKDREELRARCETKVRNFIAAAKGGDGSSAAKQELRSFVLETLDRTKPIRPFHWELEFPEVFNRECSGFDSIVGNPPFLGGARISGALSQQHHHWLRESYPGSSGQVDLVAFFFLRSYGTLSRRGTMGLLATKTIAKGDTRRSGLAQLVASGAVIYNATKRIRWPGTAAVDVSVVHLARSPLALRPVLDGKEVEVISSFLFRKGGESDPHKLRSSSHLSAEGFHIYGPGFTFEDGNPGATPLEEMQRLLASDVKNAELIHPYIGGEEMLTDPEIRHSRYVIDFRDMSLQQARQWPDLLAIVEKNVRPQRERLRDNPDGLRRKTYWWLFSRSSPELRKITATPNRLMMHPYTTTYSALAFVPTGTYVAAPHTAIAISTFSGFAVLQSRCHDTWSRFFGGARQDRLAYTPSDCFETFPFPPKWENDEPLERAGEKYYEFRAAQMMRNNEGLTTTYNRFHDPDERDANIIKLRQLHDAMDRAVLDAYGWTDLKPTCEFILDYEEQEDDDSGKPRRKKKPWRYRWPDEFRDEVLARLLALNQQRAAQEQLMGATETVKKNKRSDKTSSFGNKLLFE